MAYDDLSNVTASLITLLTKAITPLNALISVVPQSPEKLPDTTTNTLSLYLYHAREDSHYKNALGPGGVDDVERTPLSLSLYYVLTAHHYQPDSTPNIITEQKLMGYALKVLHDFPILTDSTQIAGDPVLTDPTLEKGNRLEIIYRPVTPEEATTFWNGDDQRLIRFSAFYEVRIVQLKPEPVVSLPGYVLSLGNYVLPTGAIHITSTHSVVRFTPPGGAAVVLPASPARVALKSDDPPGPPAPSNQLQLRGTRLGGGQLVLRSPLFNTPNNRIVVDPVKNPEWSIHVTSTQLTARVQGEVKLSDVITQKILPGTYGVSVEVSTTYSLPGNLSKTITTRSNEWAISLTPFIVSDIATFAPGLASVPLTTAADTNLTDGDLVGEIALFVAGQAYERVTVAPGVKEFQVTANNEIVFLAPFGIGNPGIYPVRLIVRGAEAPPYWIEVDA